MQTKITVANDIGKQDRIKNREQSSNTEGTFIIIFILFTNKIFTAHTFICKIWNKVTGLSQTRKTNMQYNMPANTLIM